MKVALLTNMIPPYRVSLFGAIAKEVELLVIADTGIEGNRNWSLEADSLPFACKILPKAGICYSKKRNDLGYAEERYFHLSRGVLPELEAFQPDVIITGEMGLRSVWAVRYGKKHNVPVIIWWEGTFHTESGEKKAKMLLRRYLCKHAKGFWSNGKESSEYLVSLGAKKEAIQEGMTGVSTQTYAEEMERLLPTRETFRDELGLKDTVLLFVGSFSERKGVTPYLEALETAIEKGLKRASFLFVGEGEQREDIEAFAASHPEFPVHITGFVNPKDIYPFYAAADLFVMPTVLDNWPLVTIEALSSGLPQIFSVYNGASADLCTERAYGVTVDPFDRTTFADTLCDLVADPLPRLTAEKSAVYSQYYSPEGQASRAVQSLNRVS